MRRRWLDHIIPYFLIALIGAPLALFLYRHVDGERHGDKMDWLNPWALILFSGCALIALVAFHMRVRRAPTFAHARVDELAMAKRGFFSRLVSLPAVLRLLALACIIVALARPRTYKKQEIVVEGIDIMIVLDLSKSMEERDLRRNRLDAGQRTIRRFLKKRKHDRIGLVVFAQEAMTQCPLTLDYKSLDQIVADLAIGDVPELGTAIGDALGLSLASLRRSDDVNDSHVPDGPPGFKLDEPKKKSKDEFVKTRSKVVILLSDGDSNWTTKFAPREAKAIAQKMGVKVFTILLGKERSKRRFRGRYAVNPELLKEIARDTGGLFFRAGTDKELNESFDEVRATLDKRTRRIVGRIPGEDLFRHLVFPAIMLLFLELGLGMTRFRRFP